MSPSQRQAVITLLDKGKDRTLLKNWRPISLLNVDYKLASKTIADRITNYLPKLINKNQAGYVQNRNISENIRTIIDVMEYLKKENRPGIIINVDFEKAFDSVEWPFIKLALKKFNFGSSVIQWFETFYKNITSCVINKGITSHYFNIERGVRQGDPLSPYLFILRAEILSCRVRENENIHGIKIGSLNVALLQYAEDTSGTASDLNSAKQFLKTVETFGFYSGLKLNKEKTEGMWIGSCKDSRATPLGIAWANSGMKILGVYVTYQSEISYQKNFADKLTKARAILNMWKERGLTLLGRTQIVKSFVISQFLYAASVLDFNYKAIREIDDLIWKFIWDGKKAKIKRSTLKKEVAKGGLSIPDFESMVKASRVKWISRIQSKADSACCHILEQYLSHKSIDLNILLHSNFCVKTLGIDKRKIPPFYIETLTLWSQIGNTYPVDKKFFLWYNRDITVNNSSVFYKDFFKAGMWFINDVFFQNAPVPFTTWVNRGVPKMNWIKWMGLVKSCQSNIQAALDDNFRQICIEGVCIKSKEEHPAKDCQSKVIYNMLLGSKFGQNTTPPRICKYLSTETELQTDWESVYVRANTYPCSTKAREFQYKFLQDILVNDYWLFKWKIKESGLCQICRLSTDNIKHIFWDCTCTKHFWEQFTEWWNSKFSCNNPVTLGLTTIFFGCEDMTLCQFIFTAKQYIYYRRRQAEAPEMNSWWAYLAQVKAVELAVAKKNNTVDDWKEKWEP